MTLSVATLYEFVSRVYAIVNFTADDIEKNERCHTMTMRLLLLYVVHTPFTSIEIESEI